MSGTGKDLAALADWYPHSHGANRFAPRSSAPTLPAKWFTGEQPDPKLGYKSIFTDSVVADASTFTNKRDVAMFSVMLGAVAGGGSGILGGIGSGAAAFVTSFFVQLSHADLNLFMAYGFGGCTALGAGVGFTSMLRAGVRSMRRRGSFLAHESAALSLWLHERYGLNVSEPALSQLCVSVHAEAASALFEDATGGRHAFVRDAATSTWFVQPPAAEGVAAVEVPAASAEINESSAPEVLSGEAINLHAHLAQQLAELTHVSLTTEQAHVLARVRQDVAATIALCRRVAPLGGLSDAQQRQVSDVLAELSAEVRAVSEEIRAQVTRELTVQQRYLIDRRRQAPAVNELLALHQRSSVEFEVDNEGAKA